MQESLALAVVGMMAVDTSSTSDIATYLLNYGVLGLVALALWSGQLVTGKAAKAKDEEIKRLQKLFEDETIPMAKTYASTMAQVADTLEKALIALDRASRMDGHG